MTPSLLVEIAATVAEYETRYGPPTGNVELLRAALAARQDITNRASHPLHVTCGAFVLDDMGLVLQVHHRTLNSWLFPGGHVEAGDANLLEVARRELLEETRLEASPVWVTGRSALPVRIDVHEIPADVDRAEPSHFHADFLFVFRAAKAAVRLDVKEVTAWRWATPSHVVDASLVARARGQLG